MVTTDLLIHSAPTGVLFDYGSTHSFIKKTFVCRIGMPVDNLGNDSAVSTLAGVALTTESVGGISLSIRLTNFAVIMTRDFNAIFCINWITRNRLLID